MSFAPQVVRRYGEGMKIRCALFDFDGTLFDSMFLWDSVGEIYLRSLGKEPKPSMREEVRALSLYQSACYFRKEYDLSLSEEEIMEGINETIEYFYVQEVLPKSGVTDFLEQMKKSGIGMGIVTASERSHIEAALKRCGMESYFEVIFTCREVGSGKDEPFIFRKAMEYFGTDRKDTLVFEDAIHAIQTAKKDGFAVAAVFDNSEKRQEEVRLMADYYIEDFEDTELFWKFASAE